MWLIPVHLELAFLFEFITVSRNFSLIIPAGKEPLPSLLYSAVYS